MCLNCFFASRKSYLKNLCGLILWYLARFVLGLSASGRYLSCLLVFFLFCLQSYKSYYLFPKVRITTFCVS